MKIIKYIKIKPFFSFIILISCFNLEVHCASVYNDEIVANDATKEVADIVFKYDNQKIETIINTLAAAKNINVILPQLEIPEIKVTLHIEEKLTLSQAWDVLNTLLDVAGFCIVPQENLIRIVKNNKEIFREPMPTYIGVDPNELPNNDQQIRYLYYLANMKISEDPLNEINGILKEILPDNAFIRGDAATNGLLIVSKANDIRAAMKIIMDLDQINFQEKVDILSLHHTSASIVAQLINDQLIKSENANPYRLDTKKAKEVPYFSGFTKVIPETRLNKLILLGRPQAIERLKDFIKEYIDVAPDTGKSMLHVYRLQYLDPQILAPVLRRIVEGGQAGGPSQASAGEPAGGGVERFFDKVVITTDSPQDEMRDSANGSTSLSGKTVERFTFYGGNNLVIAARSDDWKQIKKLIEELDIPQRQVLIEVLIADVTIEDSRLLGSMTRIPDKVPLPDSIEFQSAQFGQPIPTELPALPTTSLDADLLSNAYVTGKTPPTLATPMPDPANASLTGFVQSGTTMLSLNDNDGKTWSIWELLQLFTSTKILSHPHIMARNNKEATVRIGEERVLVDTVKDVASNYYGGATTIQYKKIPASLEVKITPRISSEDTVNLQVFVDISAFESTSASDNTILRRFLQTNANIKSGGIFALGGLIRTTNNNTVTETPFLGKIPIIGWFFKRKAKDVIKNNLTVFISPTIIEPRLRNGVNEYTEDYIDIAKGYSRGALFDSLKDPITHWFFKEDTNTSQAVDKFVEKDEALPMNQIGRKKEKKTKAAPPEQYYDGDTDILTQKDTTSLAENNADKLNDLKAMLKDEPNPFLKA
jgi:general secretion pathway protein D